MRYIKVKWSHKPEEADEVEWFFLEIDNSDFENRRVEVYPDGREHYLTREEIEKKATVEIPKIQSAEEINSQTNFEAQEITKEEFEEKWNQLNFST